MPSIFEDGWFNIVIQENEEKKRLERAKYICFDAGNRSGPLGWEPGILTTRPQRITYILRYLVSYSNLQDGNIRKYL